MNTRKTLLTVAVTATLLAVRPGPAGAQAPLGTAFTYQGRLNQGAGPADGTFGLQFTLFTANAGGAPAASPVVKEDVAVANGLFTVSLDFGAGALTIAIGSDGLPVISYESVLEFTDRALKVVKCGNAAWR